MNEAKLGNAELIAEKLVRDENLSLPIDVLALAQQRDIVVEAKPEAARGVSGMLIRSGERYAIAYATHVKSEGFRRFSIAHELGHYFLPGHPDALFKAAYGVHESRAGFGSGDQIELEADHFAAGLLMPSHLFAKEMGKYADGLAAIEKLAETCNTSLTASAIRCARLTDTAVAIVMSVGPSVEYCFASKTIRRLKGYQHLKKGAPLPHDSLTRQFNVTASNVEHAKRDEDQTDLMDWFHTDDEIEATEEVLGLGDYGKTLTIITADVRDEDDDDDDAEIERRWQAPKFSYR